MAIAPGIYTEEEPTVTMTSTARDSYYRKRSETYEWNSTFDYVSYRSSKIRQGYRGPRVKGAMHDYSVSSYMKYAPAESSIQDQKWSTMTKIGPAAMLYTYGRINIKHPDPVGIRNLAIYRTRRALSEMTTNSAVSLAEFGQTVELVTSTATTLAKAYRNLRKGRFKKVLDDLGMTSGSLSGPANMWLSYRYGWLPLLSDVDSHMKQLAKTLEKEYPTVSASKRVSEKSYDMSDGSVGDTVRLYTSECFVSYKVYVEAEIVSQSLKRLNESGLLNPLLVAWELVPLSFVADWFLPIGDYLEDMSRTAGLKFKKGFITDKYLRTDHFSSTKEEWGSHSRAILTDFPTATFSLANGMNITRLADAISLLGNAFATTGRK